MLHKHHIIPRHAGGTDNPDNLVYLTIEEHAEAHMRLYEEHGRWQDYYAWQGLSGQIGKEDIISAIYKNRKTRLGAVLTEETKNKMRDAMAGRTLTDEHKAKIVGTGRKQPQSQKDKVAAKLAKKWKITEPTGNTFIIENLNAWAKENKIDQGNLIKYGKSKGYLCERL
jgi:hypothetical protein